MLVIALTLWKTHAQNATFFSPTTLYATRIVEAKNVAYLYVPWLHSKTYIVLCLAILSSGTCLTPGRWVCFLASIWLPFVAVALSWQKTITVHMNSWCDCGFSEMRHRKKSFSGKEWFWGLQRESTLWQSNRYKYLMSLSIITLWWNRVENVDCSL